MNRNNLTLIALALTVGLASCKKEFDEPPVKSIATGSVISLDSVINSYQGADYRFTTDVSTYGVVTADEVDGNLYKNIFVQSGSSAINVRLLNSGGVYIGDSIRIYLKGTKITKYNGMLQLDSVDVDKNIIKQATNVVVTPTTVNITDLNSSMQSRLIRLNNVELDALELSNTWADAANQLSEDRTITDCSGNTVIVRTSGYSTYAGLQVAQGNGTLVAIVGVYGTTIQLYLRSLGEAVMTGSRCSGMPPIMYKNFEDNSATSGGWSNINVSGTINWATNSIGASFGSYYGQCSNFVSSVNIACETWLISPSMDLSSTVNPVFSFWNAYKYTGTALQVYVSTDYVSGLPGTGTWTLLSPTLSPGSFTWVNSGNMSLSAYKTSNVHVAFKYSGTSTSGSTWELDDIMVEDL